MKTKLFFLCMVINFICHAQTYWSVSGNSFSGKGGFLGTTDTSDLIFKTNNTERFRIPNSGRFIFHGITGTGTVWDKNLFFGGGSDFATAGNNTVFGLGALTVNINGAGNVAFGTNSMAQLTTGNSNISMGVNSMLNSNAADGNVSIGNNSMEGMGTYNENVSIGFMALRREFALSSENVSFNTVVGSRALAYLKNGQNNIAIGYNSIKPITSGSNNISIGVNTGINLSTGNGNILIGNNTSTSSSNSDNELNIGNWIYGKNGIIGIGTLNVNCNNCSDYRLFVKDGIKTEKIKVEFADVNGWADYVFNKDYQLMPLDEVKKFVDENKHLPEVPTAEKVVENGLELKEFNALLLKKIEELTLHVIQLNENISRQEKRINELENKKQ